MMYPLLDRSCPSRCFLALHLALLVIAAAAGCSDDKPRQQPGDGAPPTTDGSTPPPADGGKPLPLPSPSCTAASGGGSSTIAAPELLLTLKDRWHESWLGSPAVADLDGDGKKEIIVPRDELLLGWNLSGEVVFKATAGGRIWASPIVGDLLPAHQGIEVAAASRDKIYLWDQSAQLLDGFPVTFQDELRTLAAGDIDGDGQLELVTATTNLIEKSGLRDLLMAYNLDGSTVPGFPPNTSGAAGCDDKCVLAGAFDQNVALGDLTGDGKLEIFLAHDNAYLSLHDGTGRAFDAADIFANRNKFSSIRFYLDYTLSQAGTADDEENVNQAHFTNSAPAIADIDGDGQADLVVLSSVQNAAQSDRERGVALWVLRPDGTRLASWSEPFHVPEYLSGLWDFEGENVVAATNQVTVADLDPAQPGPELLFAGFDGKIHAVDASRNALWSFTYTTDPNVLTGGVVVADLSGDGIPEIVFNSYSIDESKGKLFILDAGGNLQQSLELPKRGAMPVPTIDDLDGDGTLELVISLKEGEDKERQVLVYRLPGSATNCLLWPTGRGNWLRNGYVP